jgi:hypothetical protein
MPVNQAALVGRRQALGNRPAPVKDLFHHGGRAAPEPLLQRFAFEILHHEERNAPVLADLEQGDDVLVPQGRRRPRLAQEAGAGLGIVGQLRPHDLEGDHAPEMGVLGLVDDAHATAPQYLQDPVMCEPADLAGASRSFGEGRGRDVARVSPAGPGLAQPL